MSPSDEFRAIHPLSPSQSARFLVCLGGLVGVLVLTLMGLCWLADPFQVFARGVPLQNHSLPHEHERFYKACQVELRKPKAIILGSSRANLGLNASHPGWGGGEVYNLGISGAGLDLIAKYFEHACATGGLRRAVVLLDYCSGQADRGGGVAGEIRFLDNWKNHRWQDQSWARRRQCLLSLDSATAAWRSVMGRNPPASYLPNGGLDNQVMWACGLETWTQTQGGLWPTGFDVASPPFTHPGSSDSRCEPLRGLVRQARAHGVELTLAVSPVHDLLWHRYVAHDGLPLVLEWRRELLQVLHEEQALPVHGGPVRQVWDFSLCPQAAMPPASLDGERQGGLPWYVESSHFTQRLGDLMLDRMLLDPSGPDTLHAVRLETVDLHRHLLLLAQRWSPRLP